MNYLLKIVCLFSVVSLVSCNKEEEKTNATPTDSLTARPATKNQVFGVARIEPEDGILDLTAGTSGRIVKILMTENQEIGVGQALLSIETAIENAQLTQAQSKIEPQRSSIEASRATVEALKANLPNVRQTYERNLALYQSQAQTKQAVDDSKAVLDKLLKDIAAAEANVTQASSRIKELEADVSYFRTVLNQKRVSAPVAGRILDIPVKVGDYVSQTTKIGEMAAAGPYIARTEVDELFAERVKVGQKAYIFSQTTGDTVAIGKVSFTADYLKQKSLFKDQATEQEDRRVREVHVRLEANRKPLIGSRVDCLIVLE
jgi:HlyD family secretion protein